MGENGITERYVSAELTKISEHEHEICKDSSFWFKAADDSSVSSTMNSRESWSKSISN